MKVKKTKVVIPCRISYAHIWEGEPDDKGKIKYSAAILIPKDDTKTIAKIEAAIKAAIEEGKSKLANAKGIVPKNIKLPLRDADDEGVDDPAYEGMMFFNASSTRKPQIVDRHVQNILDPEEVYSGCYCNVSINFFAFNTEGNKGIAAGLNNIQKVRDGERLAGGSTAEEDFDVLADDDNDDDIFD